jgi:hypothetical protein
MRRTSKGGSMGRGGIAGTRAHANTKAVGKTAHGKALKEIVRKRKRDAHQTTSGQACTPSAPLDRTRSDKPPS